MKIYGHGGLVKFQDPGGWPILDNDIFQARGVQSSDDSVRVCQY